MVDAVDGKVLEAGEEMVAEVPCAITTRGKGGSPFKA
jgi:hypothetical protein